jgi:glyoxylase-like metal-dependent hydrolase (beta-lactamase superfamily II)
MTRNARGIAPVVLLLSSFTIGAWAETPPSPGTRNPADAATPAKATLEVRQHRFGQWTVSQILESEGPFMDPATFYAGIGLDEVRKACPPGPDGRITEDGRLIFALQIFLVQKAGLNVLIEMGSGNDKERPAEPYWHHQKIPLLQTLQTLGVGAADIDYVLLSHLHEDHVGFSTTLRDGRWVPTFPKAHYVISRADWDHFAALPKSTRHPSVDDSVLPLGDAGVVDFARPGDERAGFRIHGSPAHTPGLLLFELPDVNVWFVGDLLHHPAQIARPDWRSSGFDFNPGLVGTERRKYFGYFADTKAVVYAEHMGQPYRVLREDGTAFAGRVYR